MPEIGEEIISGDRKLTLVYKYMVPEKYLYGPRPCGYQEDFGEQPPCAIHAFIQDFLDSNLDEKECPCGKHLIKKMLPPTDENWIAFEIYRIKKIKSSKGGHAMEVRNAANPRHGKQMKKLGEFLGLKAVTHKDLGNGEDYILTRKDGKELTLHIRGNRDQGGFLNIDTGLKPRKRMSL